MFQLNIYTLKYNILLHVSHPAVGPLCHALFKMLIHLQGKLKSTVLNKSLPIKFTEPKVVSKRKN